MKLLFEIDKKNYDNDGKAFIRLYVKVNLMNHEHVSLTYMFK